ncbi:MAG: Ryanodine receptor Ryr [Clostridia bacterium]|nr:Ryanodine receptor Ryr [Clostridia bacterium]
MYIPKPIDTAEIQLSEDIKALSELLAENSHEVWSAGRIRAGWTYGAQRNDEKKQHPCLVPYKDLPESEKEFDRNTSQETLKLIIKLGYKISKENPEDLK